MDDIADFVLTPFREIVEKGQTAVENAGDTQPMLKASQSLVKEGERALKKIEPLCKKHLEEYGSNFLEAIKENEEIAKFRTELTDLLWEFDDFIELDDFEAEKFAELQASSRKAAPKIYNILLTMKLEVPADNDARSIVMMRMSRPSSPPPVPLPPLPVPPTDIGKLPAIPKARPASKTTPSQTSPISPTSPPTVEEATAQLRRMMQSSGVQESFNLPPPRPPPMEQPPRPPPFEQPSRPPPFEQPPRPPPMEQPPRPPSANPWDTKKLPPVGERRYREDFERRAPVPMSNSPMEGLSPVSPDKDRDARFPVPRPRPVRRGTNQSSNQGEEPSLSPNGFEPSSYEKSYGLFPGHGQRSRTPSNNPYLSSSIPEDYALNRGSGIKHQQPGPEDFPPNRGSGSRYAQLPPRSSSTHQNPQFLSRPESLESTPSSVFDNRKIDRDSNSSEYRSSAVSNAATSPNLGNSELSPLSPKSPMVIYENEARKDSLTIPNATMVDYGPIPVDTEETANPRAHLSTIDCTVAANSSFYIHKGFCEGAQEVMRGEAGIRKTKRPGFTGATTVARCTRCFYELDYNEVELDVHLNERGNFMKHGIGFRVRFLQKSHVPTRRVDDVLYGCLFCIHQGRTLDASDATVFISQKALFQHLARHPRPLPEIPGVVVVDQEFIPDDLANNYDLHFKHPKEIHPVAEKAKEIDMLPTGVAKDAARRMYGQRLLFDRTPALEMVQGAKITGLTWPEKYMGEWAFGWHDGINASVPMEIVRLDQPPASEIKMAGTSQIRATARWKFNPKDKDKFKGDWLKFDKDEVISNINWPYPDYWCWSGTNAKGKWGIFPQAFIDTNSIQDMSVSGSDRASLFSNEKGRSGSMLSRFSTRKSARNGRPPSVAGSVGSNETQPPTLPPFMYSRN